MPAMVDLTGLRFGLLHVVGRFGTDRRGNVLWKCVCECGNEIAAVGYSLKSGNTTSCGCKHRITNQIYTVENVGICLIDGKNNYFWFDAEDLPFVQSYKWYSDGDGRAQTFIDHKKYYFTRLLLGVEDPSVDIDHINGDITDNRRCNLRLCSRTDNNRHRVTSVKGYTRLRNGKYKAQISYQYKNINIGQFDTAEEAEAAYYKKAKELFGDFAPHPRRIFFPGLTG